MNEARLRMTRIPKGADLILNKVSVPPVQIGVRMLSEIVRADMDVSRAGP